MLDLYGTDYIRDTKKSLSEANDDQIQNKINSLSDRMNALRDGKGDDPVQNANIDKQIASIKIQIETLRKQKIDESFPSSDVALGMVDGPTKYPSVNKVIDALWSSINGQDTTSNVIKRLKSLGMEDDEINELRDVYVKIYKNALDRTIKKHFPLINTSLDDYYKLNKNLFSLYEIDTFFLTYSSKCDEFNKDLNNMVEKDFTYIYNKRLKNRQYGKTKEQELDKKKKEKKKCSN